MHLALGTYVGAYWGSLCFAEPYVSFMQCQSLSLLFALYVNSEYCSSWNCQLLGIGSPLRMLFGRHSELVLTKCFVRGLFRNGQGAAELAFGSNTAALSRLILSTPLVLTPQIVRTQFRVAFDVAFFYRGSFVVILGIVL